MSIFAAPVNQRLSRRLAADERYDMSLGAGRNRSLILMALSGGGTRAAALAYGSLQALRGAQTASGVRALDRVEAISAASGGAFTAAYYGLFGERLFRDFRERFLLQDIEQQYAGALLMNAWRLPSPRLDRVDVAAELYERLFENRTFGALPRSPPFVAINATDMAFGSRFTFAQADFDILGSDLRSYSIARAVAASSAFPFVFSPLTLSNHGVLAPWSWAADEGNASKPDVNYAAYRMSSIRLAYRDPATRPFLHLLDGGIADNTGVRFLVDHFDGLGTRIASGGVDNVLVVIVNAKRISNSTIGAKRRAPGMLGMAGVTLGAAMDNYTDESVMLSERAFWSIRDQCAQRTQIFGDPEPDAAGIRAPIVVHGRPAFCRMYVAHVSFDQITDENTREHLSAPTRLFLLPEAVDALSQAGADILSRNKSFQAFLAHA